MAVLKVPVRLVLANALLLMSIPLAGFQTFLVSGAPWWDLPYRRIVLVISLAAGLFIPLTYWILSGRRWAFWLMSFTGGAWLTVSTLNALWVRSFWVALFVLILAAFWVVLFQWIRKELGCSFFDPKMKWYYGRPDPIPGLICEFENEGQRESLSVSQLDRDGAFIFSKTGTLNWSPPSRKPLVLLFRFKDRKVKCLGNPIRYFQKEGWLGVRFERNLPDTEKDLGDFVEVLRGEGHG